MKVILSSRQLLFKIFAVEREALLNSHTVLRRQLFDISVICKYHLLLSLFIAEEPNDIYPGLSVFVDWRDDKPCRFIPDGKAQAIPHRLGAAIWQNHP
jgi:hypothetical protein